jgi:hypothetical protein
MDQIALEETKNTLTAERREQFIDQFNTFLMTFPNYQGVSYLLATVRRDLPT